MDESCCAIDFGQAITNPLNCGEFNATENKGVGPGQNSTEYNHIHTQLKLATKPEQSVVLALVQALSCFLEEVMSGVSILPKDFSDF